MPRAGAKPPTGGAGNTETTPAEMEIRSIGHAAAALAGASSSAGEPGAIEEIVRARFAIARGRVRRSNRARTISSMAPGSPAVELAPATAAEIGRAHV